MCVSELRGLGDVQKELAKAGGTAMAVSVDKPADSKKVVERYQIPFDILSDADRKVINEYGLVHHEPSQGDIAHPANFLIDKEGKVVWRYVSTHVQDRADPAYVAERVRRLQSGT
jgi:peroxiredoxin Q/BCP